MTASSSGPTGGPDPVDEEWSYPGEPVGAELARHEEDLAAYIAATAGDEPPWEDPELWEDPDTGPSANEDSPSDQGSRSIPTQAQDRAAAGTPLMADPGELTDHDGSGPGGPGFESGSLLDGLGPGPVLCAALAEAVTGGLGTLPDDALAGVMLAFRRCESQAVAGVAATLPQLRAAVFLGLRCLTTRAGKRVNATSGPRAGVITGPSRHRAGGWSSPPRACSSGTCPADAPSPANPTPTRPDHQPGHPPRARHIDARIHAQPRPTAHTHRLDPRSTRPDPPLLRVNADYLPIKVRDILTPQRGVMRSAGLTP
jgi:hypothetical protein